jgi:hypothetical protein
MAAAYASRLRHPPGMPRLLEHCEALRRVTGVEVGSARARLELELGSELAARLVDALAAGSRGRAPLPL